MSKQNSTEFPDSFLPNEVKKNKSYGLQYAKAMWAQWRTYEASTRFNGNRAERMRIAKMYRTGTQPTNKYIDKAN